LELNKEEEEFDEKNFFDNYPSFFKTGKTGMTPKRLNSRYSALIHYNKNMIKNCNILDLASHDGRWSFAAIKNGAKNVLGIEGREELVKKSIENMEKYHVPKTKYIFKHGDIFDEIKKLKPNEIDTVFCFGIFYHIMDHMLLLSEIKRLQPKYLILDTQVAVTDYPVIAIREELITDEGTAIDKYSNQNSSAIIGRPSKLALEIMLKSLGFEFAYYSWERSGIKNWDDLENYNPEKGIPLKKALKIGLSMLKNKKTRTIMNQTLSEGFASHRVIVIAKNLDAN